MYMVHRHNLTSRGISIVENTLHRSYNSIESCPLSVYHRHRHGRHTCNTTQTGSNSNVRPVHSLTIRRPSMRYSRGIQQCISSYGSTSKMKFKTLQNLHTRSNASWLPGQIKDNRLDSQTRMVSTAAMMATPHEHEWAVRIGLEVHAQIIAHTKMVSSSRADVDLTSPPNTHINLVDVGIPGALPRLNKECVNQTLRTGLALGCQIPSRSFFERKHYFYCDLPLGYQITQLCAPLVGNGGSITLRQTELPVRTKQSKSKNEISTEGSVSVRIRRIQLEQDSGRSVHTLSKGCTLVDFNRAGAALMEIVTEPDMCSPQDAASFIKQLQALLRHIGTCDGRMETGSLRCDVNVSVHRVLPDRTLSKGQRVEMKNVNSIRGVERCIEFETSRQLELLRQAATLKKNQSDTKDNSTTVTDDWIHLINPAEVIESETRAFDAATGTTTRLRSKEAEADYRFMPEPDLPIISLSPEYVDMLRQQLPELPDALEERLQQEYGLSRYDASVLVAELGATKLFEQVVRLVQKGCLSSENNTVCDTLGNLNGKSIDIIAKSAANWIINELLGRMRERNMVLIPDSINTSTPPVGPSEIADILILIDRGTISGKIAKDVLDHMFISEDGNTTTDISTLNAAQIVDQFGWRQIEDTAVIQRVCDAVLQEQLSLNTDTPLVSESILGSTFLAQFETNSHQTEQKKTTKPNRKKAKKPSRGPNMVEKWLQGNDRVFTALVGRAMSLMQGKANPVLLSDVMLECLNQLRTKQDHKDT